jgi:two-component system, response regulator PdtaR
MHASDTGAVVVLVVEDDGIMRIDIADQLRSAGFEVLEAACGEEALELLTNGHVIDVLFTDIRLGGEVNGWDVGEACRAKRPAIGVIYTSGAVIEPPREVKGSRFFAKPYRGPEVVQACSDLCPR